jgi:hypothetical protein
MSDKSAGDLMREHDELADKEEQFRREKTGRLEEIQKEIEESVESVLADTPPKAEVFDVNSTGETHSVRLRFDTAELLDQLSKDLPDEFAIDDISEDGSISVRWREEPIGEDEHLSAALRGIISDGTPNEETEPVELEWKDVVSRAEKLGYEREDIERELHRMDDLDVIGVLEEDGAKVWKGDNFNRF